MNPTLGYVAAGLTVLTWGLVVIFIKCAQTPGRLGIVISMPAGLAGLLVVALFTGDRCCPGVDVLWSRTGILLLLAGICQFPIASLLYYEALQRCEVSLVAPLTRTKVFFVAGLVLLLGLETLSGRLMLACVLAVVGAFVLTWHGRNGSGPGARPMGRGILFALLASIFWALGDVLTRLVLRDVAVMPTTLLSLAAGILAYGLYILARGQFRAVLDMPRRDKLLFVGHGLFSFGAGYYLFYLSIHHIGVTRAALITAAWPIVSFLVGLVLYGERLGALKIVGVALVMASVLLTIH